MTNAATTGGTTDQNSTFIRPKLTAEQALTRLLELIRTTRTVKDFTPEKLTEVFGLEVWRDGLDKYGLGEQATRDWWYSGQVYDVPREGTKFRFDFYPVVPGSDPDMTEICQFDSDQFGAALEAMGFSKTPSYGEHGRRLGDIFDRPGMRIDVEVRGEANDPLEKIAHKCVEMVTIW